MNPKYCNGCYNDVYNHGCGGAKKCWDLDKAKVVWRKEVNIHQIPPFKQDAIRVPDCYRKPQYIYIKPNRIY